VLASVATGVLLPVGVVLAVVETGLSTIIGADELDEGISDFAGVALREQLQTNTTNSAGTKNFFMRLSILFFYEV